MKEELKKLLLAGVGSVAYSYEKASELIDEFIKKGQLTIDQGKELREELKKVVKENIPETNKEEKSKPITKEEMVELLRDMNFATKNEIEEIKNRLSELEKKINK
ncbi:hypothetical protein FDN13_08375 [Caloramator sp. E03]|uniref:phasin family protein n=1 Tax=Caloramator sp. E03 TaxID=2576307 RepID=UPI00111097FC|nr:hypothetical protein [Caloramator sp. E03]QCX33714.1 hypothetical protein FDN13_08375 [Caloramator sp. E03]